MSGSDQSLTTPWVDSTSPLRAHRYRCDLCAQIVKDEEVDNHRELHNVESLRLTPVYHKSIRCDACGYTEEYESPTIDGYPVNWLPRGCPRCHK